MKKLLILSLVFVFILGCRNLSLPRTVSRHSETRLSMGTFIRVDVCVAQEDKLHLSKTLEKVWSRFEDINLRMNPSNSDGDVAAINRSFNKAVIVGADTYRLVQLAVDYAGLTKGAFDITVGSLMSLWKEAEKINTFPSASRVSETKKMIGPQMIRLMPENRIRLLNDSVRIDLGGVAKGYAVDEAARILREDGFESFLIDAGGDLYAAGYNCQGRPWKIGIRDPRDRSRLIDVIEASNEAVTTSGDYYRYYEIQGERWSHIINPLTGFPQKGVVSATVIAPNTEEADILSTALTVLGGHEGISLIDSLGGDFKALIIESLDRKSITVFKSFFYQGSKL